MITNKENRTLESNIEGEKSAFTIKASAKAFQILSNQLYTDKPRAILRELSTNALDAHIAAGTPDKPFKVTLPSTWESVLIVKDWGTGMSPEAITELYTTYFGSDKGHTNDLVGGLGLGSKSPFAYTDQFTAVSFYDGHKYTYAAFINASNVPEIQLISKEDTDDPNGFEVHVPIKESDTYLFRQTAVKVFEFFPVMPEINLDQDRKVYADPVLEIDYEDIHCEMYVDQAHSIVMQGPIGYPIDVSAVTEGLDYSDRDKINTFLHKGWRIHAPVGTFEITASREGLSYDKETIRRIRELANGVLTVVKAKTETKLAGCKTIAEAVELLTASEKYLQGRFNLAGATWNGLPWDGRCFTAALPPDTEVREITKRQYGRGADPHEYNLIEVDKDLTLGKYEYTVLWAEKMRPFKAYIGQNPITDKTHRTLYFTGPLGNLHTWLESIGLPAGTELPKPPKIVPIPGQAKINRKLGATKYLGHCLTANTGIRANADSILDEPNCKILLTDEQSGVYNYKSEFNTLANLDLVNDSDEEIYVFYVPNHHTKVVKALEAHPGLIKNRSSLLTQHFKPIDAIYKKIAFIEGLTTSHRHIRKYGNIGTVLKESTVKDADLQRWIKRVAAVNKAQSGNNNARIIKAELKRYKSLDFENNRAYAKYVERFNGQTTKALDDAYDKFETVVKPAVDAYDACNHWNYPDSGMQLIITDWVNIKTAELLAAQKVTPTVVKEVA